MLTLAMTMIAAATAGTDPIENAWLSTYGGSAQANDEANEIVRAENGDFFLVGSVQNGAALDIIVWRIAPDGAPLWSTTWDSQDSGNDYVASVTRDEASGDLYVAGYFYGGPSSTTGVLMRLDGVTGSLEWDRIFNPGGAGNVNHFVREVAVDAAGSVYVCGASRAWPAPSNTMLVKYSPDGDQMWTRAFDGAFGGWDYIYELVIDSNGDIIGVGEMQMSSSDYDVALWKYAPNGDVVWFDTFADGDYPSQVRLGPADSIYVSGWGRPNGGDDEDAMVARFDTNGVLEWTTFFAGPTLDQDKFFDMAITDDGVAYAVGETIVPDVYKEFLTARVNPDGALAWTRTTGDPFLDDTDQAERVEIDDNGHLLVSGRSQQLIGRPGEDPDYEEGFRLASYTADGDERYAQFIGFAPITYNTLRDVTVVGDGEIVCTGSIDGPGGDGDIFVGKWVENFDCNDNGVDDGLDIAEGTSLDCNENEIPDECDIADGTALDCNHNGVPDACDIADGLLTDDDASGVADQCEALGDLDGDGAVGAADLSVLLGGWGRCDGCPADLNDDGVIDAADLALLLANWGSTSG